MRALVLPALGLAAVAACSTLPEVPTGACGNHVLDPGEECDVDHAGCGKPGSAAACRLTCEAGALCPSGSVCGSDSICRVPTGSFSFADPVGNPLPHGLSDVDGDGTLDVMERGAHEIAIYRNDGQRHLSLLARGGAANLSEDYGLASALVPSEAKPLIAARNDGSVDFFTVDVASGAVQPIVFPTSTVPKDAMGQPLTFEGSVVFTENATALPLFWDRAGHRLVVYDPTVGDVASEVASIDLDACAGGGDRSIPRVTIAQPPTANTKQRPPALSGAPTVLGIITGPQNACVAVANADMSFTTVALPLPASDATYTDVSVPKMFVGDFNKDGLWDALTTFISPTIESGVQTTVTWSQVAGTSLSFAPPVINFDGCYYFIYGATIVSADFNGDGYDDIAADQEISLNDTWKMGDGWETGETIDVGIITGLYTGLDGTGDLNHDGIPDLVFANKLQSDVGICINSGDGVRLQCDAFSTGIPAIYGMAVADINGDTVADVVLSSGVASNDSTASANPDGGTPDGGTATPDGGAPEARSEIAVMLGRALAFPQLQPIDVSAYHSQLLGVSRSPSSKDIADDIIAALVNDDGTVGTAVVHAASDGTLLFGLPAQVIDSTLTDMDGDGVPDLVVLNAPDGPNSYPIDTDALVFKGTRGSGFSGGIAQTISGINTLHLWRGVPDETTPTGMDVLQPNDLDTDHKPDHLVVSRIHGTTVVTTDTNLPFDNKPERLGYFLVSVPLLDIDGDGRSEVLIVGFGDAFYGYAPCRFQIGHFPTGGGDPQFTAVPITQICDFNTDPVFLDLGGPTPGSPPDGRLDLLVPLRDADGHRHLVVLRQHSDGTFDSDVGAPDAPAGFAPDNRWLGTTDLDGDHIADVAFSTPRGIVIAWGNSTGNKP